MTSQFGMTPPGSRAGTPPRRSGRGFMRTPSPRGAPGEEEPRRERSREAQSPRGTRAQAAAEEQPLPAEWGGRMLRVERVLNEVNQKLTRFDDAMIVINQNLNAVTTRVDSFERAIPERLHNTEARQANHVELLNGFSQFVTTQLDTMNNRVSTLEASLNQNRGNARNDAASLEFGGGNRQAEHFNVSTPPSPFGQPATPQPSPPNPFGSAPSTMPPNPFAPSAPAQPSPAAPASSNATPPQPDPWAQSRWGPAQQSAAPQAQGAAPPPQQQFGGPGAFIKKEWNISDKKVSKQLIPFDGDVYHYKSWSNRVKDHCNEVNTNYMFVFDLVESQKLPIQLHNCQTTGLSSGAECDFRQVAPLLWSFLRNNVNDKVHERSLELTFNQAGNGLELWRALFVENEGGAEQVQLGGMTSLHSFPQCPSAADMQHYIGQWQITRQKFGAGLPDIHLRQMFLNMLPEKVAAEIREKKELVTLQQCIDHVLGDLGRFNDGRLAKVHAQRLKQNLAHGVKNSVSALIEERPSAAEGPERPKSAESDLVFALSQKLDGLVAAFQKGGRPAPSKPTGSGANSPRSGANSPRSRSGLPRPNPRFEGCWGCGSKDHQRANCPEFQDMIKKNKGKIPSNYKGAYEKYAEKQKKEKSRVAVLTHEDGSEHDETELWALTCDDGLFCGECEGDYDCDTDRLNALPIPSRMSPTPTSNKFEALVDLEEEENDEDDMLKALHQISNNVHVGPKQSQKQRKANAAPSPLTKSKIAVIAQQVKSGEIDLPSLRLHNNHEYECVWALIDSGAGRPCARKAKHFAGVNSPMAPSKVRLSTATGQEVKSGGVFTVECKTTEGNTIIQEFEDTDVDMPIVSVSSLSDNGTSGSQVNFRNNGGEVVDLLNGDSSKFVKRRGVYFMKLFFKKSQPAPLRSKSSLFSGPGSA